VASLAIYSPKGGVGKSTVAANLAHLAATVSGRRTLLWEIDAQGAASFLLRGAPTGGRAHEVFSRDLAPADLAAHTAYLNLDLLPADTSLRDLDAQLVEADARKRLRKILRTLETRYDRILIDCPPGLTEISRQVFRAVDLIVVPVQPGPLSVRGYRDAAAHLRHKHRRGPALVPVLSMVDARRKLHREMVAAYPDLTVIPQASVVEQMSVRREPLAAFAPRHPATQAFKALWAEVEQRLLTLPTADGDAP
jgi:cellulose biosynthesis protein BcsQ